MHLNLLSVMMGEILRTSHCTSTNVALPLSVLKDSIVPLENIWKQFAEFVGVVKLCIVEVLKELLLLWTITAQSFYVVLWPLQMIFLKALCIGFFSFPFSIVADLVWYSVNLLILLETPKLMPDPILTFECSLKPPSSEVEISTYPEQ